MKRLILIVAAITALHSCCLEQKHNLIVEVDGWGNDSIFVSINNSGRDTLIAKDGVVALDFYPQTGQTECNTLMLSRFDDRIYIEGGARMRYPKTVTVVLLPEDKITVKGELRDDGLYYGISQFKDFEKLYEETISYSIAADSIDRVIDDIEMSNGNHDISHLYFERGDQYDKIRDTQVEYIKNNPDSDLAGYLTVQISIAEYMECYNQLSDRVKNGKYKSLLDIGFERALKHEVYIAAKESGAIAVDKLSPDFTLPSIDGKQLSLSDFRGKWVILDFWGSWCIWCIKGVPDMAKFYDKYSNDVEIVGVACNDKEETWRASVDQHEMSWVNLFDNQNTNSKYAIDGYPTKILINPEGLIKHIKRGESEGYYDEIVKIIAL